MLPLRLHGEPLRVLCIGAHSDYIEIGCGATLLTLAVGRTLAFDWVVLSAAGERVAEAREGAARFGGGVTPQLHAFTDGRFPMQADALKDVFAELGRRVTPDVIFTHREGDRHQDHDLVNRLTWQTFRDHLILEYEIPKYDGDLGQPNVFVEITPELAAAKSEHLLAAFPSQASKPWFRADTFRSLMTLRGIECRATSGLAEGFYARKALVQ